MNFFISIGYISGEVHIYSILNELNDYFTCLSSKSNYDVKCDCFELKMKEKKEKEKEKSSSLSLFSKIIKIKNYLFDKPKKNPFSSLIFHNLGKHYTSFFEKRNEITFITNNLSQRFKFSSTEEGRAWCFKSLDYNGDSIKADSFKNEYDLVEDLA